MRVRSPKDLLAGAGFFLFGGAASVTAILSYEMGTTVRMGPAYFPAVLGGVLALLGAILIARSLALDGPPLDAMRVRPVLALLSGCILYGYLVRPGGIVVATFVLVFSSALAREWMGWRRILALAAALSLFSVALFVMGLGMALPVWPRVFY